jgi:hypothetical protein
MEIWTWIRSRTWSAPGSCLDRIKRFRIAMILEHGQAVRARFHLSRGYFTTPTAGLRSLKIVPPISGNW